VPIERALRAKRFFVTGATGFLGTALVERILRCIPEAEITLLIRPGRRADAAARLAREVVKNDCFDRLRAEWGDRFGDIVASRLRAVAGDVGQDGLGLDDGGRTALAEADVVVHSAATVSFDAPLTQAVEINLLGPSRVAAALADVAERRGSPTHMIAVSTAYVASTHQGNASEELLSENRFTLDVPWKDEVEAARRIRADLEAESRRPERLQRFTKKARSEVGAAGEHLIATRAERFRDEWVSDELVKAGTARALSLGWPDAYPFTKALGERALVEQWGDAVPITVVRPSIIESALTEPRPGWIRGFRMAEPIIISYARGLLREFPGVPEGIIDVIPVDMVVAAILAVAARGPEPGSPKVYHVASGVRNPLRYGRLVELGQDFFGRNPLYDDRGQPINVPDWSFPGRGRVQRQLKRADTAMTLAERVITALPIRGKQAQLAAQIEDRHAMAKRALGYVTLYGAYTETDARYRIDNLLELWQSCDGEDRALFAFDPGAIDWDHYVYDVHLPSVLEHTRVRTKPGRSVVDKRPQRQRRAILSPDRHLAVFDLEHTLIASNVVDTYAWLASRHLSPTRRARFVADLARQGPGLLALDRRDRGDFLRTFYRRFEGAPIAQLRSDSWELFHRQLLTRSFPDGFARVREHRALGHRTLLITGALDFVIEPIRPLFDDIVCAEMEAVDGRLTGHLTTLPPTGESRALLLDDYAALHSLSLEESVAYADSTSDLAMLEAVGFPVAVNPEARLSAIARRRGWHVEHWSKAPGGSHRPLPLGPFDQKIPKAVMGR
jgi:HAD superfamily hydrolase (TIGR01490 family)